MPASTEEAEADAPAEAAENGSRKEISFMEALAATAAMAASGEAVSYTEAAMAKVFRLRPVGTISGLCTCVLDQKQRIWSCVYNQSRQSAHRMC